MAIIGIGLAWVSYTVGLYGYCLIKGYDISPKDLFNREAWPPAEKAGK